MPRLPEQRNAPGRDSQGAPNATELPTSLADTLDHFALRLLTDALNEQTRRYWLKRAEDFENAKPTPGQHHGRLTADQIRAQWRELDQIARACRARAEVSPLEDIAPEALAVWGESA